MGHELSSWGHRADAPGDRPPPTEDPRVQRTRAHVLEQARRLLAEEGPGGLHFSTLAARARVSRQTLYRYWSTPEALVTDLVSRRVQSEPTEPALDLAEGVRSYLNGLRQVFADPAARASYGVLMAAAARDEGAAEALRRVTEQRRGWLNERLTGLGVEIAADEFALVAGPVVFTVFVEQREVDDELVERVVADTVQRHRRE